MAETPEYGCHWVTGWDPGRPMPYLIKRKLGPAEYGPPIHALEVCRLLSRQEARIVELEKALLDVRGYYGEESNEHWAKVDAALAAARGGE